MESSIEPSTTNLFAYEDYRLFLRDWYNQAKLERRAFSFRNFSKKANFKSPNFYKLVMDGNRNLTEDSLAKFMVGLGLKQQEKEYFRNLVFYNQTSSQEKKDHYYQKLNQSKKLKQLKAIHQNQSNFYESWYHPVIRELITLKDFDGSSKWISKNISPSITIKQIERSLKLLEDLQLIKQEDNGKWVQTSPLISTGPESDSVTLLKYHQALLSRTQNLLPQIPQANRDISSLTLGIKKSQLPELKSKIQEFRKEILKMVSMDSEPDEVVQLNIQLLPVSYSQGESK